MNICENKICELFDKWCKILRIENSRDIHLELIDDESFKKTGDLKIDCDDKKPLY